MRQFFLLVFSLTVLTTNSQTFNYRNYSVENGLASSTVYVAIQDRKGFMWFGTENGVNRFDGNFFEHFSIENGLSDNDVLRIFEDSNGRIWFLTANGHLSFYEDGKIHNEKTDPYLSETYIKSGFCYAFEDSRKRIWFCSINSRIAILDKQNVIRIQAPTQYPNAGVGVFEDSKKNINVFCESVRYIFDEKNHSLIFHSMFPGAVHSSFFMSPDGLMHFVSFTEVYQVYNDSIHMIYPFKNSQLSRYDIFSATKSNSNTVFICTKNGVISFIPGTSQPGTFLPDHWINSVTVDNEGNIWFMTRGDGIYFLPKQYGEQKIYAKPAIDNNDIHSLTAGKDGTIWMGCANNSISVLENNRVFNISLPTLSNSNRKGRIMYMDTDKDGNIWSCSDITFYKISGNGHNVKMFADTAGLRTMNISFNSKGSAVVAFPVGICRIVENKNQINIDLFKDTIFNKRNYCVFYDLSDRLFMANIDGLHEIVDDKPVSLSNEIPLLKSRIISISQAEDSSLVLGTDGYGVIFYKNGKIISHITSSQGLSSSICRKIRISHDKIFVCTNKGLTRFTYHNGNANDFKTYSVSNGLPSGDVRDVIIEKGFMYVATSKGLAVLEENALPGTDFPPGIYIKGVLNNAKQLNFDSTFTLPFRNNTITIKYSAITYSNPDDVIYEYSIHADRKDLQQTTLRELIFPDVSPGKYTFSVRAKKKNSDWSPFTSFSFNVEYPYYQRWWFYLLMFFLLVGSLTLLFVYLHRRSMRMQIFTLEKRNALNLERSRISEDMHDDLGADLSRIVVISEVIKIESSQQNTVHSNISKISEFATGATKKMEDIIWALNPQNDTLRSLVGYINQYCFNFFEGTGTKVDINTDELIVDLHLNAKQRRNIFLVIKEIANNAMKYASAEKFFISFRMEKDILHIIAGDDGKGFDESSVNENGNGLKNIRKRITELSGTLSLKSAPLKGTWFEISMHLDGTL